MVPSINPWLTARPGPHRARMVDRHHLTMFVDVSQRGKRRAPASFLSARRPDIERETPQIDSRAPA